MIRSVDNVTYEHLKYRGDFLHKHLVVLFNQIIVQYQPDFYNFHVQ